LARIFNGDAEGGCKDLTRAFELGSTAGFENYKSHCK
jgi:hypothetical protein